ncbi:MAG: YceI family protein [Pseudomonadota bacterium]
MAAPGVWAAPTRYVLDRQASSVDFIFLLSGQRQRGTMPVLSADIRIDAKNLTRSRVDVVVDVTSARTGLIFATQAMKGKNVLNAAAFPTIRFASTAIRLGPGGRLSDGAQIRGNLTMRGVTRPVVLAAAVYRPPGSRPDELDQLSVRLTGVVSRSSFGASGFPDLVDDPVQLDIRALIRKPD